VPATRVGGADEQRLQEVFERDRVLFQVLEHQLAAALPGQHDGQQDRAQQQREPAAVQQFQGAGREQQRCP
jgi:hypothetical protein